MISLPVVADCNRAHPVIMKQQVVRTRSRVLLYVLNFNYRFLENKTKHKYETVQQTFTQHSEIPVRTVTISVYSIVSGHVTSHFGELDLAALIELGVSLNGVFPNTQYSLLL